jgi:type VI secretion system protein ImpA
VFDFDSWLAPLNGDNPSGGSLRDTPQFLEIERLMEPRVEVMRDERNNPVSQTRVPVDWTEVLRRADDLRAHGRDLRLLVIVTRAMTNERGLPGLADGLTLIARTFDDHWETMHPELRAGGTPRDAALRRINALAQLQNDQEGVLADLMDMTMLAPRGIGPLTGRDLQRSALDSRAAVAEAASGLNEAERAALAAQHEQLLNKVRAGCAAMADQARVEIEGLLAGARAASEALAAVEKALSARLDGAGPFLPALARFLGRMAQPLDHALAGQAAAAPAEPAAEGAPPAMQMATAGPAAVAAPAAVPGQLNSRADVVKVLDLVIAFYDRTEPSSPIPHLVRRVRRMVPMDFMELMEELAPAGLKEFRSLAGITDDRKQAARPREER